MRHSISIKCIQFLNAMRSMRSLAPQSSEASSLQSNSGPCRRSKFFAFTDSLNYFSWNWEIYLKFQSSRDGSLKRYSMNTHKIKYFREVKSYGDVDWLRKVTYWASLYVVPVEYRVDQLGFVVSILL